MNALETKVLELIGENPDSPDVYVDTDAGIAPIRDSINDAIQEIAMLTGGNKRQYIVPLREGQMFYRFGLRDGYFGWICDAWDIDRQLRLEQTDTIKLSQYDPRWMVGSGFPEAYLPVGQDVVGFYKKPSSSAGAIELTIAEIPIEYATSTERVKLRDQFQYAVIHYAVAEYWASAGDAREAMSHSQMYLDALGLNENYQISPQERYTSQTVKEPWPTVTA